MSAASSRHSARETRSLDGLLSVVLDGLSG
jgi:hypothetical protein